jgi:sn-glycerol 3-phosphate transport system ATP-binding protein
MALPGNSARAIAANHPAEVTVGIRPEHLTLDESGWSVQVESVELLGAERLVYGRIGEEQIIMRTDESDHPPVAGDTVKIAAREDKLHWFDAGSGKRAD